MKSNDILFIQKSDLHSFQKGVNNAGVKSAHSKIKNALNFSQQLAIIARLKSF